MKQRLIGVSMLMMLPFIACEDNEANENEKSANIIEITTDNVNDGPYYFNFSDGAINSTNWHLSYQNLDAGGGNYMPSFLLNNTVMLNVDEASTFEDISQSPETNLFAPSNGKLGYGGDNEVLIYDMQSHKISVSDSNYIIYDTVSHKVFKIRFDEYSSGVVIFRFAELASN
jgi:formylmethanofuran dehydrogenase subunit A